MVWRDLQDRPKNLEVCANYSRKCYKRHIVQFQVRLLGEGRRITFPHYSPVTAVNHVILHQQLARQTAISDFHLQCSVEPKIKCMLQLLFENQKQYMEQDPIKLLYSQIWVLYAPGRYTFSQSENKCSSQCT